MSTSNSFGRFTQSIKTKGICILLVNDDQICHNIVSNMLHHCRYEVFSYETEMDALSIIREKKDTLEIILTNVQRTYANKYGIIEHIEKEFKLQIILMSPDVDDIKKVSLSEGGGNGVTVYILKSKSVNEVNNLWATAMAQEKSKREISSSSGKSEVKRKIESDEENGNVEKKARIVWTKEMHQKFLEAIDQLGHDKTFPKKIVELMNVPGLTRENVASHLQKYRMCMKRAQEGFTSSSYDFSDPFTFNNLQQESRWNPFLIRSRNTTPSLFSLNSYESRLRTFPNMPLLNKIQIKPKPDYRFRVCGDEKKNILLSIEDSRVCSNTRFAGFRLSSDGKSVAFGQNGHFGDGGRSGSYIQKPGFCPELGNDDSSLGPERDDWMSYVAGLLGVDESLPAILTQQQPPAPAPALPPGPDRNEVAATILTQPPPSAGLEWGDWDEPPGFSSQQPPLGNEVNDNFEIFSDFTSPGLCELGKGIDENGVVDATGICGFDDLLFNNQDLT